MTYAFSSPVIVLRETSPAWALDTIRSGRCFAGPILGDGGMNAVIENHPDGDYCSDQAVEQGAILHFEWDGKIDRPKYTLHPPADVLVDQHPHRAFFMAGTGQGLTPETGRLRLVAVSFTGMHGWHEAVGDPPSFQIRQLFSRNMWLAWWSGRSRKNWEAETAKQITNEVAGILATKPAIMVVLPPFSLYRSIVANTYPRII